LEEKSSSLNHSIQGDKWEFDKEVTSCFEDMLERSIPQYSIMRKSAFNLGCKILEGKNNKSILDLGCSNGLSLEPFVLKYGAKARYKGVDVSEPMLKSAKERFQGYIDVNIVDIQYMDVTREFPDNIFSLIMSVLTIQFTPIEYRQKIIQNIYDSLEKNGGFIMVEKVLGNCSELNEIMVDEYLSLKENNGYTKDQIIRKQMALEGVLVPVTSAWNVDLLKQAGFRKIDVFWRWMNFEGYICIK